MARIERMRMLTDRGERVLTVVSGSTASSWLGGHRNALKVFRDEGNASLLADFKTREIHVVDEAGKRIETLRFATDLDMIRRWAKQGELDAEGPYIDPNEGT
jgi:hypothetical protein